MNAGNPGKFDRSQLTADEQSILDEFLARRQSFDRYLFQQGITLFTCPGCGYPTLTERGAAGYCIVCSWEDDGQDDSTADEVRGGPNGDLSLTENRLGIGELLHEKAEAQSGSIHTDPLDVLRILQHHNEAIGRILEENAGEEAAMDAYQKEVDALLSALTNKKN